MTQHATMMEAFYAARDTHTRAMDDAAIGYATEEAEYCWENPKPQLKDFMGQYGSETPPGVCEHGFYLVDCPREHDVAPVKLRPSERKAWNRSLTALARERGCYRELMQVWDEVTACRLAGLTPEDALGRVMALV